MCGGESKGLTIGSLLPNAEGGSSAIQIERTGEAIAHPEPKVPPSREQLFKAGLRKLASRFTWLYRDVAASDEICVVFSSSSRRHAFPGQDWGTNVLFLLDSEDTYFTAGATKAAELLGKVFKAAGFRRVLFLGSSKGAFGAVLWTVQCARADPSRIFRALAFSAQTSLYPFNPRLNFPSYRKLWTLAESKPRLMASLKAHGDLRAVRRHRNALVTFVYGERNDVDRSEAGRIFAPNVRKYPVPLRFHGSVIPFTVRHLSDEAMQSWLDKLYARAGGDDDLRKILPLDPQELRQEIQSMVWLPNLRDLIHETLNLGPERL